MKKLFLTFAFTILAGSAVFMIPQDAQAWWDDDDDWYDRPWYGGGPWYGGYRPYYGYGYPYGGYGYPYGGGYYGGYYGGYPQQGTAETQAPAEGQAAQPAYPAYPAYPY